MSDTPTPLTRDEATSLEIPGEWDPVLGMYTPGGAWRWADPIHAGQSDSAKWRQWPDMDHRDGPYSLRVARDVIDRLYEAGYALVKLDPSDG